MRRRLWQRRVWTGGLTTSSSPSVLGFDLPSTACDVYVDASAIAAGQIVTVVISANAAGQQVPIQVAAGQIATGGTGFVQASGQGADGWFVGLKVSGGAGGRVSVSGIAHGREAL